MLWVGDPQQLPSVSAGRVLHDVIAYLRQTPNAPLTELTQVYRQQGDSQIRASADLLRAGARPLFLFLNRQQDDLFWVARQTPQRIQATIVEMVAGRLPARLGLAPQEVRVLAPMYRGAAGVHALNHALQQAVNPAHPTVVKCDPYQLRVGDPVVYTRRNDRERGVMNGSQGVFRGRDDTGAYGVECNGQLHTYRAAELRPWQLAYAMTIHMSQGSEFPCVVVALTLEHAQMLQRPLFYTALTRGQRMVVVCGESEALERAWSAAYVEPRQTGLEWTLQRAEAAYAEPQESHAVVMSGVGVGGFCPTRAARPHSTFWGGSPALWPAGQGQLHGERRSP